MNSSSNKQTKKVQMSMKQTRLNYWLFELLERAVVQTTNSSNGSSSYSVASIATHDAT